MADLAHHWGMPGVARRLRGMTLTQAEAFVVDTVLKARTGGPVLLPDARWATSREKEAPEFANELHNAATAARNRQMLAVTQAANPLVESLRTTGALPSNFVTKQHAIKLGWQPGKALANYLPNGQIGGDEFLNTTGVVPSINGRIWYEADVGLVPTMKRASQPGTRLLYSSDGLLYISPDHYETVYPIGQWRR